MALLELPFLKINIILEKIGIMSGKMTTDILRFTKFHIVGERASLFATSCRMGIESLFSFVTFRLLII